MHAHFATRGAFSLGKNSRGETDTKMTGTVTLNSPPSPADAGGPLVGLSGTFRSALAPILHRMGCWAQGYIRRERTHSHFTDKIRDKRRPLSRMAPRRAANQTLSGGRLGRLRVSGGRLRPNSSHPTPNGGIMAAKVSLNVTLHR